MAKHGEDHDAAADHAGARRQLRQRLVAPLLLLLVIAVPLGVIMAGIVRDAAQELRTMFDEYLER